jgi:O-antigen/teichoic acid export membrane protein
MLAAVIIVSIPRLSAYLGKKKTEDFNRTANQILNALIVIVIPAMVGLTALSRNIVFIIAGQEYVDANISLKILSVALLFSIFSWFYTSCVLIPYRCENKVLMATIVAALANIGLNFILIPIFKQDAAAFTTLIAEALSMTITWWYGRKYFKVSFLKKDIMSVIIGCIAICIICTVSEKYISSILISTAFSIIVSVLIYMIVLLTMKNQAVKTVLEIIHLKK